MRLLQGTPIIGRNACSMRAIIGKDVRFYLSSDFGSGEPLIEGPIVRKGRVGKVNSTSVYIGSKWYLIKDIKELVLDETRHHLSPDFPSKKK